MPVESVIFALKARNYGGLSESDAVDSLFRAEMLDSRRRDDGVAPSPVGKSSLVDYLPMQKLEKMRPSRSSGVKAPVISPRACWA